MSQVPFGASDLSVPALAGPAFLELLEHDFGTKTSKPPIVYEQIIAGTLSRDLLKTWVKDMYLYWDTLYFNTAAVFIKTNEPKTREALLRKLVQVEGRVIVNDVNPDWTNEAYEELWLQVGEGLGVTRDEAEDWQTFTRAYFSLTTLCMYSRSWEWTWLDGVANLYAADRFYLKFFPAILESLSSNYKVPAKSLKFFEAVIGDSQENAPYLKEALAEWACTTERQLTGARAFRERIDIEYQVLQSLDELTQTGKMPFQIPEGVKIPVLLSNA